VDGEEPSSWRATFLAALEASGNVSAAAHRAGVHRCTAYRHRAGESDFRAAWDEALEVALDALEAEARRRALEGWEEPVFHEGKICGHIRKYADRLLMMLLKAYRPEFRDNAPVRSTGDTTVQVVYVNDWRGEPRAVDHGNGTDGLETFRSLGYVPALPSPASGPGDPSAVAGRAS
jgi:hypothetical protein